MYQIKWTNPALPIANKQQTINVPPNTVVADKTSVLLTGKGVANYGKILQENLLHVLENFANDTAPPYATVGQHWYDTSTGVSNVCWDTNAGAASWKAIGGIQVGALDEDPPTQNNRLGDVWIQGPKSEGNDSPYPLKTGTMLQYTGYGRFGGTNNSIGGWAQVWPPVVTTASRFELDQVFTKFNTWFGTGGMNLRNSPMFPFVGLGNMDQSLRAAWNAAPIKDFGVLMPANAPQDLLRAPATAQDWDENLSIVRWQANRLDVPQFVADSVSDMPFVQDGQQPPLWMTKLSPSDIRYPTLHRRSNAQLGIATLVSNYSELNNVLDTLNRNRYSLRGISGTSGVFANFSSGVSIDTSKTMTGDAAGATVARASLTYRFNTDAEADAFIASGAAFSMVATASVNGQPTLPGDVAVRSLLTSYSCARVTGDALRIFSAATPRTMSGPLVTASKMNVDQTYTLDGATIRFTVVAVDGKTGKVSMVVTAPSPMNGQVSLSFQTITDKNLDPNGNLIFPTYLPVTNADVTDKSAFLTITN